MSNTRQKGTFCPFDTCSPYATRTRRPKTSIPWPTSFRPGSRTMRCTCWTSRDASLPGTREPPGYMGTRPIRPWSSTYPCFMLATTCWKPLYRKSSVAPRSKAMWARRAGRRVRTGPASGRIPLLWRSGMNTGNCRALPGRCATSPAATKPTKSCGLRARAPAPFRRNRPSRA